MIRKTYGAETILRKKKKSPFPVEVMKEVKSGEDLFSTLFANKIKEIKHQAKFEEKKKNSKKKCSKAPSCEVLREEAESLDISNLVDPFDALLIAPSNHPLEHKNVPDHSYKLQRFESDKLSIVRPRNNKTEVEDDENKENTIDLCETLEDHKSLASDNKKEEISGFKKEPKFFSKNWKKNNKPSFRNKKKYEKKLNDSLSNLADDLQDMNLLMNNFMSGKIDIRGKEKEKLSYKSMKGKTRLETKSFRTSEKHFSSSEEEEDERNEDGSNEFGSNEFVEESSEEFLCAFKGIRKKASIPINSTPATTKFVAQVPKCTLSPILPVLAQCSNEVGECTERLKEENEDNLSLDLELCHTSVVKFQRECSDSEQGSLGYSNISRYQTMNKRANGATNSSVRLVNSPDPFADSESSKNENILNCLDENGPSCTMRKHLKETISYNALPNIANHESLHETSSDLSVECEKQEALTHNLTLGESSLSRNKSKKVLRDGFQRKETCSVLKNFTRCHENYIESDRFENLDLSIEIMRTEKHSLCLSLKEKTSKVQNQQNASESLNKMDTSQESSRDSSTFKQETTIESGSDLLNKYSENCEEKSSLQSQVKIRNKNLNLEESLRIPGPVNLNLENSLRTPSPVNLNLEEPLRTPSPVNLNLEEPLRTPSPVNLNPGKSSRTPRNLKPEESLRTPSPVNVNSEKSLRTPSPVNVNSEKSLRTPSPVNLNQEEPLRTPSPVNLNREEPLRTPSPVNLNQEESLRTPSPVNLNSEKSLRTPSHEIEESCLNGDSIQKLAHSFARRRSHVVVPLARFDFSNRTSVFRDVYLSSNASLRLTLPPTNVNCSIAEESHLDESEKKEMTFKDVVLDHCGQTEILDFSKVFSERILTESKKIGEGVFGEVFSCKNSESGSTVIKIMPIEGSCKINGETQKTYEEILPEIVVTMQLSNLRTNDKFCTSNFPELVNCWCVQGAYPPMLLKLWHEFDKEKSSENDSPEILPEDQVYIILELSNVGTAMESFTFSSAMQAFSAFTQVTYTLAAAESALEFEHRDLHWGNILIQKTKARSLTWKLNGKDIRVQNLGIQASVIDFTLSRITYDDCCIYNNLANDPEIFEGQGDYQFEIYRLMRNKIKNNWHMFEPYNNVLWLSYALEKLISEVYYHSKTTKVHQKGLSKLRQFRKKILDFKSATEVALSLSKSL